MLYLFYQANQDGKQLSGSETIVTAIYHYEYMVSCQFPNSRKKRSTSTTADGYDISLSYDQSNYGDSSTVLIFDENCMTCNASTLSCVQLVSMSKHKIHDTLSNIPGKILFRII